MSETIETIENSEKIDTELLSSTFPKSYQNIVKILELENIYTYQECSNNAEKGREMSAQLQNAIDEFKEEIVNEMFEIVLRDGPNAIRKVKTALRHGLKLPASIEDEETTLDVKSINFLMRTQLSDTIFVALTLKLRKNPHFKDLIEKRTSNYEEGIEQFRSSEDALNNQIALFLTRASNIDYAILTEYNVFRRLIGDNLNVFSYKTDDIEKIRLLADEVFDEISKNRDFGMESVYNLDHELGKNTPVTVVYQNCNFDDLLRFENMALVQLVGNQEEWDKLIKESEVDLDILLSGHAINQQINKANNLNTDSLESVLNGDLIDFKIATSILGNLAFSVRWSDGELTFSNIHLKLSEFLNDNEKPWYEYLRLHILIKLRALLLKKYEDNTVIGIERDLRVRNRSGNGNSKKTSFSKIRKRVFPRPIIHEKSYEESSRNIQKSTQIQAHRVTGHKRKLPNGFFATAQGVKEAIINGVNLEFIEINGVKRYTETFVKDHVRGGNSNSIVEAVFKI